MRSFSSRMYIGSHLPLLMKCVDLTTGPIVEVGCGFFSTPYLHWRCFAAKRRLVSYETDPKWFQFVEGAAADFHEVHCLPSYQDIDLSEKWAVAFVDHGDGPSRPDTIAKVTHAEYVVVHDTNGNWSHKYGYDKIFPLFKYHYKFRPRRMPFTSVLSNVHDLKGFSIP